MHAQISHHRVDENYVDEMCGLFFEEKIQCGNMECSMFYEEVKAEAIIIIVIKESIVRIYHEAVCDLATIND